jgi:hypothetical protein
MNGSLADDLPSLTGGISPALKARLQREDLLTLELVLLNNGVRTLKVLEALCDSDVAELMVQATNLQKILRHFQADTPFRVSRLFVDAPLASTNRGVLGLPSSGSGSNSQVQRGGVLWPGLVQAMPVGQEATPGSVPPMPATPVPVQPIMLPQPSIIDTKLVKSMPGAFLSAQDIVGNVRMEEAIRCVLLSNQHSATSILWAMHALAALNVPKLPVKGREEKEAVKAAKKAARDLALWRVAGSCGGMDSKDAVVDVVTTAIAGAPGLDENTISQMTNGFCRLREELSGMWPQNKRAESPGREGRSDQRGRGLVPEPREAGPHEAGPVVGPDPTPAVANAAAPRQHHGCVRHPDPREDCWSCVALTNKRDIAVAAIQPQAEPEPVVHCRQAMIPQSVVVGGQVGRSMSLPPQIPEEDCSKPQQWDISSLPPHSTGAVCSTVAGSPGGHWNHERKCSSMFGDETQAQGMQLHNITGSLAMVHCQQAMIPQSGVVGGQVGRSMSLPPQPCAFKFKPEEDCSKPHSTGAVCSTVAGSPGGHWHHEHKDSNMFDDETQAQGLQLRNITGSLAVELARTSLLELNKGDQDNCGKCAELLGDLCPYTSTGRCKPLAVSVVNGLSNAAQRSLGDGHTLRQVLRALARVAGPTFPLLALFKTAGAETDADRMCAQENDESLVLAFSEIWSWQLKEILQLQDCQAVYFSTINQGQEQLREVVALMLGFKRRCQTFSVWRAVARHTCMAFSSLKWIANLSFPLVESITTFLVQTTFDFVAYQDIVHESIGAIAELCKEHGELFGMDLSRGSSGNHGTISQRLQIETMSLAYTFRTRSDMDNHTAKQVYRLLAHTNPVKAVITFVTGNPCRPVNEMLWSILDQSSEMLKPAIVEWKQNSDGGADLAWAGTVLRQMAQQGGTGFTALTFPGTALAPSKSSLFQSWVQTTRGSNQVRLLLVGILFGPKALLPQLHLNSGDEALFSATCRSLVDLNALAPFESSLWREVAASLVNVSTPWTSSSCLDWVEALKMVLQGLATDGFPNEDAFSFIATGLDHQILKMASNKLIETVRWAVGWESWTPFIQEALLTLSIVYTHRDFAGDSGSNAELLRTLAESMKAKSNDTVQAHKQADELLAKLECSTETHHC